MHWRPESDGPSGCCAGSGGGLCGLFDVADVGSPPCRFGPSEPAARSCSRAEGCILAQLESRHVRSAAGLSCDRNRPRKRSAGRTFGRRAAPLKSQARPLGCGLVLRLKSTSQEVGGPQLRPAKARYSHPLVRPLRKPRPECEEGKSLPVNSILQGSAGCSPAMLR